ncbi:MAG: glutamate synthase subunit beta [Candidatus Dadabacteria bacterium]|nr:MAG: glutamate synthase subunit beta [Candidatus Dadabacteria bacterium]
MGKITGFMEYRRETPGKQPAAERVRHFHEFELPLEEDRLRIQGARCMDCGVPFCHNGCPLGNIIPDFNDLVYRGHWEEALEELHSTNNFPEFTGRVCPAPCEEACVLNINDDPVTIKLIERSIIDRAWERGLVRPSPAVRKTGKRVAIVGSGPAGLACAQQLGRAGHEVTVFERADRIGGLLRYGIPDFKLEKRHIDRRIEQMQEEGVVFRTGVHVGRDIPAAELLRDFDAIVLACGSTQPRDLPVEGRELAGIHFAMEFLPQQNKRVAGDRIAEEVSITAAGKNVVVIGGGDTGSDCIGTSNRQGARSVVQLEILPQPPAERTPDMHWPYWPPTLRTSTSHEEGARREFSVATKRFSGRDGHVTTLHAVRVDWKRGEDGRMEMHELPGTEFELPADLVLLAMGFVGPERGGLLTDLGVEFDERGNVRCDERYASSVEKVFSCGDARRGQSLVVWAIWEGRECAHHVDAFLMGSSELPLSPAGPETGGRPI